MYDYSYGWNTSDARPRTPSPDFEANPLAGWKQVSDKDLRDSDLHPSQLGEPRLYTGPYEAAVKRSSWAIPAVAHPLSLILGQLARPKFCSSNRWLYTPECNWVGWLEKSQLTSIKIFSSADGSALGTIGSLNLDAVRKLATASPFGMGGDTVYDDSVRRGFEVRAAQLQFGLVLPLANTTRSLPNGASYFRDIADHVGRYLFPGARSVKLVFYKLAMYTPGGHFKMHKDTTHADSHVGTLLIGCGFAQDHHPGDEEWEAVDIDESSPIKLVRSDYRSSSPSTEGYSGGDLVILNDFGEETRYHIRPGQVLAFCTDVPHAVDVVTSGVKATLQFDIYLEDASVPREHTVAIVDLAKNGRSRYWTETDDSDDVFDADDGSAPAADVSAEDIKQEEAAQVPCPSCGHPGCVLSDEERIEFYLDPDNQPYEPKGFNQDEHSSSEIAHWRREEFTSGRYPRTTFTAAADRFVIHLLALLSRPEGAPRTVAFLLSHMYRKRSIRPEYLKTVDDVLYRGLVATGRLKIVLHHVTFEVDRYCESPHKITLCPPYTAGVSPKDILEPVMVLNRPGSAATYLVSEQDEAIARGEVYVGNEAFEENSWYVAGAMFVSLL